jgi:hypothetical protein
MRNYHTAAEPPSDEANEGYRSKAFSVPIESEPASDFCFDAFSLREPVSIPDQVRDRLSLENALVELSRRGR